MSEKIDHIIAQMKTLESELEAEFALRRIQLKYKLHGSRAVFEQEILKAHRAMRVGLAKYVFSASILIALTAPIIYAVLIPFVLLDIFITVYQWICFPIYGIEKVKRSDYFVFDRYHLEYLNLVEKINCAYCSYGNGLMAYASEICGRTEKYWCPIKHARKAVKTHEHYVSFAEFGDAETFHKKSEIEAERTRRALDES